MPLSEAANRGVLEVAQLTHQTPFAALAACVLLALRAHAETRSMTFGVPLCGRSLSELMPVVGPFAREFPLLLHTERHQTVGQIVTSVGAALGESLDKQDYCLEDLAAWTQSASDGSTNPLNPFVDVSFDLEDLTRRRRLTKGGLSLTDFALPLPQYTKFNLAIKGFRKQDGLDLAITYNLRGFTRESIQTLALLIESIAEKLACKDFPVHAISDTLRAA